MAKLFFVIALLLAVFTAVMAAPEGNLAQKKAMFQYFAKKHGRTYKSSEEADQRFQHFLKNYDRVAALQAESTSETQFGLNKFFDFSEAELQTRLLNPNSAASYIMSLQQAGLQKVSPTVRALPDAFDWRTKGAVTAVKDQADCGSCWAFSTTGNVEGVHFLKNGTLTSLSEQHLVDCDHECDPDYPDVCDDGCNGGLMLNAFQYILKNKGIATEQSYPYRGVDGKCKSNYVVGASISGAEQVDTDENKIAQYLVDNGPLAVALNANDLPYYTGGVFAPKRCDPQGLNHGVLMIGFGKTTAGQEYWLVKNSWGKSWGEQGFFRILKGKGTCGINTYVVSVKA